MVHEELEELVEVASLPVSRASLADVEPDAGAPDATAAMEGAALLPRVPTPRAFLPARKLQMAGATVFFLASATLLIELVMFSFQITYPGSADCLPPYDYTTCVTHHTPAPYSDLAVPCPLPVTNVTCQNVTSGHQFYTYWELYYPCPGAARGNSTGCVIYPGPYQAYGTQSTVDSMLPFGAANLVGVVSAVFWIQGFAILVYFLYYEAEAGWLTIATAAIKLVAACICAVQPVRSLAGDWDTIALAAFGGPSWTNLAGITLFHAGNVLACVMMWKEFKTVSPLQEGNLPVIGMWVFTAATTLLVAGDSLNYLLDHLEVAHWCGCLGASLLIVASTIYMYAARPDWWFIKPQKTADYGIGDATGYQPMAYRAVAYGAPAPAYPPGAGAPGPGLYGAGQRVYGTLPYTPAAAYPAATGLYGAAPMITGQYGATGIAAAPAGTTGTLLANVQVRLDALEVQSRLEALEAKFAAASPGTADATAATP